MKTPWISPRQRAVLQAMLLDLSRFICRRGYAYRVATRDGNYVMCVTSRTVRALIDRKLIAMRMGCPFPRCKHDSHWTITAAGQLAGGIANEG